MLIKIKIECSVWLVLVLVMMMMMMMKIAMMMLIINIVLALNGLSDVCGQNIALDIVLLCSNCISMVTARR